MHAATAGDNTAAPEFQQDLFEVFDGDLVARGDLMNGEDLGVFHRKMEDRARRVLAFGRYTHWFDGV